MPPYRHLFGPVLSRRLGRSLGIDLVAAKSCSYDCIFCQIGPTPATTLDPVRGAPVDEVLAEFDDWLASGGQADHLTLAGAGEPTLHPDFGAVIDGLRQRSAIPTVLMSNGSLFDRPGVRAAAARAAIVKVSVSGWDEASWRRVNRPHPALRFDRIMDGLRQFAASYTGELWVELFLVPGVNDAPEQVARIAALVAPLRPARVHLNTAIRPAAEAGVRPVPEETLRRLAALFRPPAETPGPVPAAAPPAAAGGAVLETVARHPSTAAQLAAALGRDPAAVESELRALERAGLVVRCGDGDGAHYRGALNPSAD